MVSEGAAVALLNASIQEPDNEELAELALEVKLFCFP